ncbi:alpha/beta fold hydrolase [Falsirhodobacter deserti]|uniref:alpha/beta fold hydrolase n=1 Tax=Falsirhodobacter deserti TaxID=1365611 RepID=UPI000FE2F952|nr:alpha/beta hydrolase [Falsirhodobacter deserti]
MRRGSFEHDDLIFSFLDGGGDGKPLLALHGHWMGASDFEDLAADLAPAWRVVALDQRGFGESDHTDRHALPAYISDAVALLDHLGIIDPVPVIGHSFGGIVAYHMAAQHPERVECMVIEDIGVEIADDSAPFVAPWAGIYRRREELEAKLGPRLAPYLQRSIERRPEGWQLNFDPDEFLRSEQATNGDHWGVWLASECPALVVGGRASRVCNAEHLKAMADRRKDTMLVMLDAGHSVHVDARKDFGVLCQQFLERGA